MHMERVLRLLLVLIRGNSGSIVFLFIHSLSTICNTVCVPVQTLPGNNPFQYPIRCEHSLRIAMKFIADHKEVSFRP